jgi:hypothetical protein
MVSTPLDVMQLSIDGERYETQGITSFRLPLGKHELMLTADGMREIVRTLEITDQSLCALSFEPDPIESEWTTSVLYGPFDHDVKHGLRSIEGLRLYFETLPLTTRDLTTVSRAYFGPSRSQGTGSVLLRVDFDHPVGSIEVDLACSMLANGPGAWSRVEMGASADELIEMVHFSAADDAHPQPEAHPDPVTNTNYFRPSAEWLDSLARRLAGRRQLFIRWSAGGAAAGGDDSTLAQVLRADVLPGRKTSGELLWSPAVRIRTR